MRAPPERRRATQTVRANILEKPAAWNLQPLLLKRQRELEEARAFNNWLSERRLAKRGSGAWTTWPADGGRAARFPSCATRVPSAGASNAQRDHVRHKPLLPGRFCTVQQGPQPLAFHQGAPHRGPRLRAFSQGRRPLGHQSSRKAGSVLVRPRGGLLREAMPARTEKAAEEVILSSCGGSK